MNDFTLILVPFIATVSLPRRPFRLHMSDAETDLRHLCVTRLLQDGDPLVQVSTRGLRARDGLALCVKRYQQNARPSKPLTLPTHYLTSRRQTNLVAKHRRHAD